LVIILDIIYPIITIYCNTTISVTTLSK